MAPISILFESPSMLVITAAVLGLCVGSFLNVVIHRLPKMMEMQWHTDSSEILGTPITASEPYNLAWPRSQCPSCAHPITALENIPVLSYLYLRGKCAGCSTAISVRYPIVELITALLSAYAAWHFGWSLALAGALIFCWSMIALTGIDIDTFYLPDSITLPILWLGLIFNLNQTYAPLQDAVVGAVIGYLTLWSIFWLFKWATGKEGMGYGDFKLLAAIGAWLGWQQLPLTILLSSIAGAIVGVTLIVVTGRDRHVPLPFGPFLAIGGLVALFYGNTLTQLYLGRL